MGRTIFETTRTESFQSKLKRIYFNFFPAYRRTGGRISFLSSDWREIHIRLGLNWTTRNYVGTVFGGSIYGALDPIYMVQLINILGPDYVVWDKSATVKFIKPIKKHVFARFEISDALLEEIKSNVASANTYTVNLPVAFKDEEGVVYAEVIKTIYIADKEFYKSKRVNNGG